MFRRKIPLYLVVLQGIFFVHYLQTDLWALFFFVNH